jgi:superfamily I DNA/RNA helicase
VTHLSDEQLAVVGQPLRPVSVIACAGSGKTLTAIYRVARMRSLLQEKRGRVALLSFSNVAVDTFRSDYQALVEAGELGARAFGTAIETMDSFITSNVLRPHGHRTMKSARAPYLVNGNEPFLKGFTFTTSSFPQPLKELNFTLNKGQPSFFWRYQSNKTTVDSQVARNLIERVGRLGAYTHDLGRYWTLRTLTEQSSIPLPPAIRILSSTKRRILAPGTRRSSNC